MASADILQICLIEDVGEKPTDLNLSLMPVAPYRSIVQKAKLNLSPTVTRKSADLHIKTTSLPHEHFDSVVWKHSSENYSID